MLTITDQITNPNSAGKLSGGINAAIPSPIATQPSHFGSGTPRRIARPLETTNMKARTVRGTNRTSLPRKFSA
jgi:hypothetical protein